VSTATATTRRMTTPPKLAARYGVDVHKVVKWIEAGELRAVNLATSTSGRPRWAIDEADILVFEQRRQAQPPTPTPRRRRRQPTGMIEYF
jgi:transposase